MTLTKTEMPKNAKFETKNNLKSSLCKAPGGKCLKHFFFLPMQAE